uniref:Hematopoietic cell signal transducer n=1 Tax=Oncorhynchus kisutch TaxID=8019 RepID=A0A8C7MJC9_ONCKI
MERAGINILHVLYTQCIQYYIDNYLFFIFLLKTQVQVYNPSCYRIEPGTMASIIAADVILTIAVVIVTYHCASRRRRRNERGKSTM